MHHQANSPPDERVEKPDDLRNIHQVDGNQQSVDQDVDDRVNKEANPLLIRAQLTLCCLVLVKRDSLCHGNHLLFTREHSTGDSQALLKSRRPLTRR